MVTGAGVAPPLCWTFPRCWRQRSWSLTVGARTHVHTHGVARPGCPGPECCLSMVALSVPAPDLDQAGSGGSEAIRGWKGGANRVHQRVGGWAPSLRSGRLRGWSCCFGEVPSWAFRGSDTWTVRARVWSLEGGSGWRSQGRVVTVLPTLREAS